MANLEKIYSNKIWLTYLVFLDKHYGKSLTDKILLESGTDRIALVESGGFKSAEFSETFSENAIKYTGNKHIAYLVGRSCMDSLGKVEGMVLGLTSPSVFMKLLAKIEGQVALNTIINSERLGKNQYRVKATFKNGFQESIHACQNRLGCYEALSTVFGLPHSKVEHPLCVFKGDKACEYLVTLPEYRFILFKKAAIVLILVSLSLGALNLTAWRSTQAAWISLATLCLGQAAYAYYKHQMAVRSMEWNSLANEGLTAQNRALESTNTQINALQELTQVLGDKLEVQAICDRVVTSLVKEFNYGSSQIWLLNENGVHLENRATAGYLPEVLPYIQKTDSAMEKEWTNPYGSLVQTLKKGETLLVNDVASVEGKLSSYTREFIRVLKPSCFILAPLHQDQAAIGFLTAEHHHGQKLDQKDKLFFQSISHVVANALIKAGLFRQMEEKIIQLQTAKEMAIQSEKLSSLGQMVAGVAHEISNPLNFLINIIPEVRRDVDGLEKIRSLVLNSELNGEKAKQFKKIDEEYELESHLEDKAFIFEKVDKALKKSMQIAASLKVFSRNSAQATITEESFRSMLKDVLDLLPNKVRGETIITVDIPENLVWKVNKNEMEQAFLAIINNAIDAMEKKGKLEIEGRTLLGEILISFKDNGPGIPPAVLSKIFEAFYTTKPIGKGTGLGLSIAMEIVKKFGGDLVVESVPQKGTAFIFKFPLAIA